jgi:hypothetical protein
MGSVGVKTTGDGLNHYIEEKVPDASPIPGFNILITQFAYDQSGAAVTGGPMAVGADRAITDVLEVRDAKAYFQRGLAGVGWNDNGKVGYLTIDWSWGGGGAWHPGKVSTGGGAAGVSSLNGLTGAVVATTPNSTLSIGTSGQDVTFDINLANANLWAAAQTLPSSDLLLLNPAGTYAYTFVGSAISAARNLTVPLLTGNDTLAVLGLAQAWLAAQSFPASGILLKGSSTGYTTFASANASSSAYTATFPANTGTIAELNLAQAWAAAQTFPQGDLLLLGSSTGATTLNSGLSSSSSNTLTLPTTATDTLAALGTAETWTALQTFGTNISLMGKQVSGSLSEGNLLYYNGTNIIGASLYIPTQFLPSNPTGTSSTTYKNMGVGSTVTFTPAVTGVLEIIVTGGIVNATATTDGYSCIMCYGTGTAPGNGTGPTGTTFGATVSTANSGVTHYIGVNLAMDNIVGLSAGTTYWFDFQLEAVTGGTASIANLSVTIKEVGLT